MGNKSLDKTFNGNKGWESNKCNDSGNIFNKWLTDDQYAKMPELIARGFSGVSLTSNTAENVALQLKKAVSLKPDTDYGSLQNVLCGFMFVFPWDDTLTGHACLFLVKFCDEVGKDTGGKLQGKLTESPKISYEDLKRFCRQLKGPLEKFVKGSDQAQLCAVSKMDEFDLFDKIWDDSKFKEYCEWLKGNLSDIIRCLNTMSQDSSQWTDSKLKNASSAGPFKYGFVFKDNNWQDRINENLQGPINELTTPLNSLLQCLNGDFSANSEAITQAPTGTSGATAAGAAGGILGLGGAGAGAAYGLNLFGFKNLVTGLISSFLK